MRAVINVPKKNQYSRLNGLTFEVGDIMPNGLGLVGVNVEFPKNQVDFSFKELIIVDLVDELKVSKTGRALSSNFECLLNYCEVNKYEIPNLS